MERWEELTPCRWSLLSSKPKPLTLGSGGVTVVYSDFTPQYTKNIIKQQNNNRRLLYTRCYPKSKRLVNTSLGVVSLESDNSDKNKQGTFTAHRPIFLVAINLSNSPFCSFHLRHTLFLNKYFIFYLLCVQCIECKNQLERSFVKIGTQLCFESKYK